MKKAAVVFFVGALMVAADANAQMLQWKDRGFLNASGGLTTGTKTVTTTLSFPLYDETATVETTREIAESFLWDVTGGVRVKSNLGVALSVSGRSANSDGAATASIPHPIFYEQPRTVSATISGMKHSEVWVSPLAVWMFPVTEQLEFMAMAGPTIVRVNHETVGGVTVAEASSPAVTVTLDSVSKSVWGFVAGVDGRYLVTKRIGIGGFARYGVAKVNLTSTAKLDIGGFQLGAGVRIRF